MQERPVREANTMRYDDMLSAIRITGDVVLMPNALFESHESSCI